MSDFERRVSYQNDSFDPAAAFQFRRDTDSISLLSERDFNIDEEELIKAARQELKAKRAQLDRGQISKIVEEFVAETGGVTFAARLAQIAR